MLTGFVKKTAKAYGKTVTVDTIDTAEQLDAVLEQVAAHRKRTRIRRRFGVENQKTAVVTGGSRGIGRAICARMAKMGMNVIFNYNSGEEAAKETVLLCEKYGVKAHALKADESKEESCAAFMDEALRLANGRMDVLVNNAGITRDGLLIKMSDKEFDDVINVNLKGLLLYVKIGSQGDAKAAERKDHQYQQRHRDHWKCGTDKLCGEQGGSYPIFQGAGKGAFPSRKINVNVIAPGMIETDMTDALSDALKEKTLEAIPFREIGKPEDIANAAAFLASEESRYIATGACVDEGW